MCLTLPAVTHLSMSSHTAYPPLHSGLKAPPGDTYHTPTPPPLCTWPAPRFPLTCYPVLACCQSPHRGNTQELGALLCLAHSAPVNWRMWIQFLQSMASCVSILSGSHGLQASLLLYQPAKVSPRWKPEDSIHVGHWRVLFFSRSSRHSWLWYWSDRLAVKSCSLVSCTVLGRCQPP